MDQISKFLRMCNVPSDDDFLADREIGLTIGGEDLIFLEIGKRYFFESIITLLPRDEDQRNMLLKRILSKIVLSVYETADVVSVSREGDAILLQRMLSPTLQDGKIIFKQMISFLEHCDWWKDFLHDSKRDHLRSVPIIGQWG